MASPDLKTIVLFGIAAVLVVCVVHQYDPTLFGLLGRRRYDGFVDPPAATVMPTEEEEKEKTNTPVPPVVPDTTGTATSGFQNMQGFRGSQSNGGTKEGFADLASMEGPAAFASAEAPAGCYPRDQLTPTELLPADQNTIYAQQNPMGVGSLKGKNFLSAGALIGVNTVGQSLRNANLQLRSEPPNPQVPVSIFLQSTIGPDVSHRPLEVGS
jgi:hypothetical protein